MALLDFAIGGRYRPDFDSPRRRSGSGTEEMIHWTGQVVGLLGQG
jgi:hypothetical protein